ncbi:gastrula zinc finger protein xFG20-1-like [Lutzomyia longipalpis]|uniref:gastrula zinc finger protein xFG20-1-like n=1 Tax=Lutzomyia longipalpis TaxID=7200 RepID=UPI002483B82D|nr:gastrula zinc finger protein xFG20-1-like [Lutzomyia longipalpis]
MDVVDIKIEQEDDYVDTSIVKEEYIVQEVEETPEVAGIQESPSTNGYETDIKIEPQDSGYSGSATPNDFPDNVQKNENFTEELSFKCLKCGNKYNCNHMLRKHMFFCRGMNEEPQWKCSNCGNRFTKKTTMEHHEYMCKNRKKTSLKCVFCRRKSKKKIYKKKQHESRPTYTCEACGKSFIIKRSLEVHLNPQFTTPRYVCSICNEKFQNECLLKQHKASCCAKPRGIFQCDLCSKNFPKKLLLQQHIMSHVKKQRGFICDFCGNNYEYEKTLEFHETICRNMIEAPKFPCITCGNKYPTEAALNLHIYYCINNIRASVNTVKEFWSKSQDNEKTDGGKKHFECSICCKELQSKEELVKHMTIHTATEIKHDILSCKKCGIIFTKEYHLKRHFNNCPENVSSMQHPFSCKNCGHTFKEQKILEMHYNDSNTDVTTVKYICTGCKSKFKTFCSMKQHKKTCVQQDGGNAADVIKSLKCELCSLRFNDKFTMLKHFFTHVNAKTFSCRICGNKYSTRISVKKHEVMCEKKVKKPLLPCKMCDNKYYTKNVLNNHYNFCVYNTEEATATIQKLWRRIESFSKATTGGIATKHYKCSKCDKMMKKKKDVMMHVLSHVNGGIDPKVEQKDIIHQDFPCTKCGKIYKNEKYMKTHLLVCQEEKPPLKSSFYQDNSVYPICSKVEFEKKEDSKNHIEGRFANIGYDNDETSAGTIKMEEEENMMLIYD